MQLARRSQNTLTSWTHFQKEPHQPYSLPEEARTHSLAGHIFRGSLISHAACQKKPDHTHILDTFSEGVLSAMQLARRSQNTLTSWTHFQKEPHQPCSLPEEARTHSLAGHIFRGSLISYWSCLTMPEHTHILDSFSEGASSVMQLGRTHSLAGHICRGSLISHAACQKKPEHTHILDRFSEGASSAMQLARRSQNTLTSWTHFQPCSLPEEARTHSLAGHIVRGSLISHAACQKKPEHTHKLDTFSERA